MTQQNSNMDGNQANTPIGRPSQAEGERQDSEGASSEGHTEQPTGRPSQAEGDRQTIEEDLAQQEQ